MKRATLYISLLICFCLLACAGRRKEGSTLHYPSEIDLAECIAVFPFQNDSETEQAGEIVADIMANELQASRKFRVMFRDESIGRIRNQNISTTLKITPRFAAILGEIIGVDAVLHGVVIKFETPTFGKDKKPEPRVALAAKLISSRSANIIWEIDSQLDAKQKPLTYERSLVAIGHRLARKMVADLDAQVPKRVVNFTKSCGKPVDTLDLDRDGTLNIVDRCPLEGGPVKNDGCPEKTAYTDLARLIGERIFLAAPVQFIGQGSELAPSSVASLKGLAELLKNNHFLSKIMIESYLTEEASAESKKLREELAFSRAQSVKDFLIGMGIDRQRLAAVGYGEIEQLGKPKAGIEFHVIEISR